MKPLIFMIALLCAVTVEAGVFKCTDNTGKTVYRSTPCAPGQGNIQINLKTGTSSSQGDEMAETVAKNQQEQAKLDQEKLELQQEEERQAKLKQAARDESAKNQFLIKSNPKKYSPFAIPPYDLDKADELPLLVKNFQNRLPEIEHLRRVASEKALAGNQCGRVEAAELNIKSTNDALVFLIDCSSGKKFYYTEQELKT